MLLGASVAVVSWRETRDTDSAIGPQDPGRLPAGVALGATPWTLTWLPPGYRIDNVTRDELALVANNEPTITITAQQGGVLPAGDPLALAPQLNGIIDASRQTMSWQQAGWTLTIHADNVSAGLLVRLATGIVETKRLQPPAAPSTKTETVPDLVGLDYQIATRQLEEAGFAVRWGISSRSATNVGAVETIRPSPGDLVAHGSTIVLGVIGAPTQLPSGRENDDTFGGVSGDLPIAVGYWSNRVYWGFRIRTDGEVLFGQPQPIVFLRGELVGYGVGPDFETIQAAANNTQPPPSRSPTTTASGTVATTTRLPDTEDPFQQSLDRGLVCQSDAASGKFPRMAEHRCRRRDT